MAKLLIPTDTSQATLGFLKADGSIPLTADWAAGDAHAIRIGAITTGFLEDQDDVVRLTIATSSPHLTFDGNTRFNDVGGAARLLIRDTSPEAIFVGAMGVEGRLGIDKDGVPSSVPDEVLAILEGDFTSADLDGNALAALKVVPELSLSSNRGATGDAGIAGELKPDLATGVTLGDAYGISYGVNFAGVGAITTTTMFGIRSFIKGGAFLVTENGTDWGAFLAAAPNKTGGTWAVTDMHGFLAENQGLAGIVTSAGVTIRAQSGSTNPRSLVVEGSAVSIHTPDMTVGGSDVPTSTADINGSLAAATVAKTGAYTAAIGDHFIDCDASGGAFTVTLPAASGVAGRMYHIKKTDSSGNAVTVDGNSGETIDDALTQVINIQYDSMMIICDGSNWHII